MLIVTSLGVRPPRLKTHVPTAPRGGTAMNHPGPVGPLLKEPDVTPGPRILVAALILAACSSDPGGPGNPVAVAVSLETQPAVTARSGLALEQQPIAQIRDAQGGAVAQSGVLVTAVLASGGGALTGTTGVRTDAQGRATWTDLGIQGLVGVRTLRFEAAGLAAIVSNPIQLGAGVAASLVDAAGNNQVAPAGAPPPVLPRVRALDALGNVVPGASVTFEVQQGGGQLTGAVQVTGADGTASPTTWTLGPQIGPNQLSAFLTQGGGSGVVFTATATVGPPALLTVVEGNQQTTTIGTAVAIAPGVRITDAFGNPVAGVTVTLTPAAGSGQVTGGTPTSNADGIARATSWAIGFTPGENTLTASRDGLAPVALTATGISFVVAELFAGTATNCARIGSGALRCWGSNAQGQLGDGTVTPRNLPGPITSGLAFTRVVVGATHACGLAVGGNVWCWGSNNEGQLGDGSQIDQLTPAMVVGGGSFTDLALGGLHTCALRGDGVVLCWGSNGNGRLGDGTAEPRRLVPTPVSGGTFTGVSASSGSHTCALGTDQRLWCWGANNAGRLGDGSLIDRNIPTLVVGGFFWTAVSAGLSHTCALTTTGAARCWGVGTSGQLGTGSASSQSIPVPVTGGLTFTSVSAGGSHTCAVTIAGAGWCWGDNGSGRLGDGTQATKLEPVEVSGGFTWARLGAGGQHSCGWTTVGSALCWGRNIEGQVGDGVTINARLTPVAVKPPAP